jgi:hypothetical protein
MAGIADKIEAELWVGRAQRGESRVRLGVVESAGGRVEQRLRGRDSSLLRACWPPGRPYAEAAKGLEGMPTELQLLHEDLHRVLRGLKWTPFFGPPLHLEIGTAP